MMDTISASNTDQQINGTTTISSSVAPREWQDGKPSDYRLAQKPDGTLIMQGNFKIYKEQNVCFGHCTETDDWRDLETVKL